jgi:hypothetical protein
MAIGETPFIGQRIANSTSLGDVEISWTWKKSNMDVLGTPIIYFI